MIKYSNEYKYNSSKRLETLTEVYSRLLKHHADFTDHDIRKFNLQDIPFWEINFTRCDLRGNNFSTS